MDSRDLKGTARQVQQNKPYRVLVKVGLVAYGVVHLVIAWLAFRLAFGQADDEASNTGALRQLAQTPIGLALMWLVVVGMATLVIWQGVAAGVGYLEYDGGKRVRKRLGAAGRLVVYAGLGVAAAQTAIGARTESNTEQEVTSGLLGLPGGPVMVGLIGVAIVGYGGWNVVKGVTGRYNEEIRTELDGVAKALAVVGHVAKGVAFAVMGGLFIWAAASYDPEKAGGLDAALNTIRSQPAGSVLLVVIAVGIACFGVWCFIWAAHAKHA